MDEPTPTSKSNKTTGLVILLIMIAVISGSLGYLLGVKNAARNMAPVPNIGSGVDLPKSKLADDSIISSQEAVAVGKIIKADNGSITMQSDAGKIAGFKLASVFNIYPLTASVSGTVKASQNTKDLKLNSKYQVHLVLQGANFVVTSIQELPTK